MIKFLSLLILTACATATITLDDLDYSTVDIQKAASTVLAVGIQPTEGNERILESKHFRVPFSKRAERVQDDDVVRGIARIDIIGDRRPYSLDITVTIEEKNGNVWTPAGRDKRLAKLVADQIQDYLVKHKDKNLIDHFRPF
jgi:hypothetical protein